MISKKTFLSEWDKQQENVYKNSAVSLGVYAKASLNCGI